MAIINILAKTPKADWGKIANDIEKMKLGVIEFFPIPNELGFDDDALAVNVRKGFANKKTVLAELSLMTKYLLNHNFTVTELYDSVAIDSDNMLQTFERLLA